MTQLDPLMVGVDGSRASATAIRYAAHEAQRQGTGIHLVHVVPHCVPIIPTLPLVPADLEDTGRQILHDAAQTPPELLEPRQLTTSLLDGPRIPTLVQAAEHSRLLVIGSERRRSARPVSYSCTPGSCPASTTTWSPRASTRTSGPTGHAVPSNAAWAGCGGPVPRCPSRSGSSTVRQPGCSSVSPAMPICCSWLVGTTPSRWDTSAGPRVHCSVRATARSRSFRPQTSPWGLPTWCWSKPERSRGRSQR